MPVTLTADEIESVREIVGDKTYSTIESLVGELNDAQKTATKADVVTWNVVRDKHLKVKGGRDGVDLDNERKRKAVIKRVRQRLQLPVSGGLSRIPVGAYYDCEA